MERFRMKKRKLTLTKLFWHYLITVGISLICILILSALLFWLMFLSGLVLPANTAEMQAQKWEQALACGASLPSEVPDYYRWACFDQDGQMIDHSNLSKRQQEQLYKAVKDKSSIMYAIPFNQYHRFITFPDGNLCVLQYDFSLPYTVKWMQKYLPEYQLMNLLFMLISAILVIVFWTNRYAHRLHSDVKVLTAATQAIAEQRLDTPFQNRTNVGEFGEILQAMDLLRNSLSTSLHEQWLMEQQRTQEIAALTHDLKTPLTVISGNSELLAEETLNDEQRKSVDAILRNAQRMESYLGQLRSVIAQQNRILKRKTVDLESLFLEWAAMGKELCDAKKIRFMALDAPKRNCNIEVESVNRAVLNVLDNAVRYTPENGEIYLSATIENDTMNIVVQDGGPGFSDEAIAHGCEVFYTDNSSRQGEGHMGMGLYYAKCVAEHHHGKVMICNTNLGGKVTLQLKLTD